MGRKRDYQTCCQCHGWVNLVESDHMIFYMRNGSTQYAHHCMNGCCSHWYQDSHTPEIEHAQLVRHHKQTRGGGQPKDYNT